MVPEPFLQRLARTVEPHRRVVGRQPQLSGGLRNRNTIDNHASQNRGVGRLELLCLREHAPAASAVTIGRDEIWLVDEENGFAAFAKLIEQHVADNASDPSLGLSWVTQLVGALESPVKRRIQHFLAVDLRAGSPHVRPPRFGRVSSSAARAPTGGVCGSVLGKVCGAVPCERRWSGARGPSEDNRDIRRE